MFSKWIDISHNVRKIYLRTCAPSENSDQPAHSRIADNEVSDQTVRMRRFICVFVGHTYPKVRFLMLRLIYGIE